MATSFLVSEILADAARLANVPPFSTSTNVTLAQATYWLNQSARSLSALFRQKMGEDNDFLAPATLTVPANVGVVSLPADCGEVNAVMWVRSSSEWRLLTPAPLDALEDGQTGTIRTWLADGADPQYRIEGQTLAFYPLSSATETVVIYYTSHLSLASETSFLSRLDADRWITLDLIARVKTAQGRDAAMDLQDKLLLESNLFSSARKRDTNGTHTIRDTRSQRGRINRGGWRV